MLIGEISNSPMTTKALEDYVCSNSRFWRFCRTNWHDWIIMCCINFWIFPSFFFLLVHQMGRDWFWILCCEMRYIPIKPQIFTLFDLNIQFLYTWHAGDFQTFMQNPSEAQTQGSAEEVSHAHAKLEHDYQQFLSECGISKWGYWRGGSHG